MTLDTWIKRYADEYGNVEGWEVISKVLDDGIWIDAFMKLNKGRHRHTEFWDHVSHVKFWEAYCELDGGHAASLKVPSPMNRH